MNTLFHRVAPAVALLVPLSRVVAAGADPAQPSPGPAPQYQSAFASYKPWRDIPPGDWRGLNGAASASMGSMSGDGMATMSHGHGGMSMPGMSMPGMSMPKQPASAASAPGAASAPHAGHVHGGQR